MQRDIRLAACVLLLGTLARSGYAMNKDEHKSLRAPAAALSKNVTKSHQMHKSRKIDESECREVSPTFCTNVDWLVPASFVENTRQAKGDLQVEMMAINYVGTPDCKKEYKNLHCRYLYPRCVEKVPILPCRSECEHHKQRCGGTLLHPCNSFPTTNCGQHDPGNMTTMAVTTAQHHHRSFLERISGFFG
mmetsp:Transcript_11297/g.20754  ORF Transcript_11297/g.20754 Transcript_11297/m.20754 type:complete len:190 (-) Transcript_11297:173-742(-)